MVVGARIHKEGKEKGIEVFKLDLLGKLHQRPSGDLFVYNKNSRRRTVAKKGLGHEEGHT